MNYQVYATSHYVNAGRTPVAVLEKRSDALKLAKHYCTCSFCSPGRSGQYSSGTCYRVRKTNLPPTDEDVESAITRIEDKAMATE
jgi:hypothetical protein